MRSLTRVTNAQQIRLIEWIKAGKGEAEIAELALQETPPFVVSHRKYLRYRADFDPERARELLELKEQTLAKVRAYRDAAQDAAETPPPPPAPAQSPAYRAASSVAKTIGAYIGEMLAETDAEQKKAQARQGRDAFK